MSYIRRLYFSPNGRAGRLSYNLFFFVPLLLTSVVIGFFSARNPESALVVIVAFLLLTLWPMFVMTTKRLHDVGLSGWWLLVVWGASLGLKLLLVRYGPIYGHLVTLVVAMLFVSWPGTNGPNRYGAKP
jgi:uncharacterized membrane protein YhaH (DUF805 family)